MAAPNPSPASITDPLWDLWLALHALVPSTEFGGIVANKPGYHASGSYNQRNHAGNYSVRYAVDLNGPWWKTKSSALDWTFPEAQASNYTKISLRCGYLLKASQADDPRLWGLREWYGQADKDLAVEGWDILRNIEVTSDASHRWHLHLSFLRLYCGDPVVMAAILSVVSGETLAAYKARGGRLLARKPRTSDTAHVGYTAGTNSDGGDDMFCSHGDDGDKVKALQLGLLKLDPKALPDHGVDADYGDETAGAVKRLLGGDGKRFGPDQYDKLQELRSARHAGKPGEPGRPGEQGEPGEPGPPGRDGVVPPGTPLSVIVQ